MDWLFDTSPFVPRGACGDWTGGLAEAYLISHAIIFIVYSLIPAALIYVWRRKRESLPSTSLVLPFAVFVIFCGLTHLFAFSLFWFPTYRAYVLTLVGTAIASLYALAQPPAAARYQLASKTPEEYKRLAEELAEVNHKLAQECDRRQRLIDELEARHAHVVQLEETEAGRRDAWLKSRHRLLDELLAVARRENHHG